MFFLEALTQLNLEKGKELTIEENTSTYVYMQQNCASVIGNIIVFWEYCLLEKIKRHDIEGGSYKGGLWDW